MNRKIFTIDFTGTAPPVISVPQTLKPDLRGIRVHTKEEYNQRLEESRKRRPGRKPLHYSKRRRPVTISLSPVEKRELTVIGNGSLTGGIRYLITAYRQRDIIQIPRPSKLSHKIDPPKSHLTKINPHTNKPWVNPDDADEEDFHS